MRQVFESFLDRVDSSIISEGVSNHVIPSSLNVVDIVAFISLAGNNRITSSHFASLGYPKMQYFVLLVIRVWKIKTSWQRSLNLPS